ncbi:MAG: glycosyltransferase [Candidatus Hydrogenedentes bacterium]|nr:glycosyltransferase [Candidatus Hydrogenedentota bacterium]
MKLLCVCSALDLRHRFGCTPAWWQFLKGLHEEGHDVIAIPYMGAAIETPWWRAYPNPCAIEGQAFSAIKKFLGQGPTSTEAGFGSKFSKAALDGWVRPRWSNHLSHVLLQERNVDAVIVFSVPVSHFTGIPAHLRERYRVPVFYFDGDVPASLPRFGGFASGFNSYEGANPGEYDGFMCNSAGGAEELLAMGAKKVRTVHWGVDPSLYEPLAIEENRDVFFYGYGVEYRQEWVGRMIVEPSRMYPEASFSVGGKGFPDDLGHAQFVGDVPHNTLRAACCRSRINLNITRDSHASVRESSSTRPFELAAMGRCIVSNPLSCVEAWFTPGEEILVVESAEEAVSTYKGLLQNPERRRAIGEAARKKVLAAHTHRHRAREIAEFVAS